jgi:hypothetical protein
VPMARLSALTHQRVQNLAVRQGRSQQEVLDAAVELLDRKQFFEEAHREYESLRGDRNAMESLNAERRLLDGVSDDGVDA